MGQLRNYDEGNPTVEMTKADKCSVFVIRNLVTVSSFGIRHFFVYSRSALKFRVHVTSLSDALSQPTGEENPFTLHCCATRKEEFA